MGSKTMAEKVTKFDIFNEYTTLGVMYLVNIGGDVGKITGLTSLVLNGPTKENLALAGAGFLMDVAAEFQKRAYEPNLEMHPYLEAKSKLFKKAYEKVKNIFSQSNSLLKMI